MPYKYRMDKRFWVGFNLVKGIGAVRMRALLVYAEPERWRALILRGMAQDWSWERSAHKYLELYQRIYRKRNPDPA